MQSFDTIEFAHRAFLSGELTPVSYLDGLLKRISKSEGDINSFAFIDIDKAKSAAVESNGRYTNGSSRGILDGIPVGIKDIIDTADMPTAYGSSVFRDYQPSHDAACVTALRKAGAIVFCKTVTTEFACGASGPTRNAMDLRRTPGGSSSGSAAAVGAGMLPVALGTQTHGSILRPAVYNNSVGYKPTLGSLNMTGIHPVSGTLDHLGTIARNASDAWLTAQVISNISGPASGGNIALPSTAQQLVQRRPIRMGRLYLDGWAELESEEQDSFNNALISLTNQGVEILDCLTNPRLKRLEERLNGIVEYVDTVTNFELRHPYTDYVSRYGTKISSEIRLRLENSRGISTDDYLYALSLREEHRALVQKTAVELQLDGFILPASSGPAPLGLAFTGSRTNLYLWSWLGFPSVSIPVLQTDMQPWGIQICGTAYSDFATCGIADWIHRTLLSDDARVNF